MKKVALLVLVFFVGGCGEQSKNSLGDDNLQLARKFLALASSDEKRALALDMADETFEFRWMGLLPDENGNLEPGLVLDKEGYFGEYWELVDEFLVDWTYEEVDGFGAKNGATLLLEGRSQAKHGPYNNEYAFVFKIVDGKIISIKEFNSDLLVATRVYDYQLLELNDKNL
jgi:ketosteroid isomerase-like protein